MPDAARPGFDRADLRVLGLFRIYFGCVLLVELACLWPHRAVLFTDGGVLGAGFLAQHPQVPHQLSVFFWCHTLAQAELGFAIAALVLVAYVLGAWTGIAQGLLVVCVVSLHARNLFLETGAALVAHSIAVWTLFLPLGERYSFDAWRARRKRASSIAFASPVLTAIRIQCAVIYLLSGLHKLTAQWIDGSAIHYVLWQNRTATPLAAWLRLHEPAWFSPLASWATVLIELLIAGLVLWPRAQRRSRMLALWLALGLHGSIAALMNLGIFSWVMIALVLLTVRPHVDAPAPSASNRQQLPAVLALAVVLVAALLVDDPWLRRLGVRPPGWLLAPSSAFRLRQRWAMYDRVPEHDGMVVVDAVTQSGSHIDPFTGRAPDFRAPLLAPVVHSEPITSYLTSVVTPAGSAYLGELERYVLAFRASGEAVRSFQLWWVAQPAPPPGATEACCPTRTLLYPNGILSGRTRQ